MRGEGATADLARTSGDGLASCRNSVPSARLRGEGQGEGLPATGKEGRMTDYQIFEAGDVVLQAGLTYRQARLAYKTFGTLDRAKANVIVYPTSYGAQH